MVESTVQCPSLQPACSYRRPLKFHGLISTSTEMYPSISWRPVNRMPAEFSTHRKSGAGAFMHDAIILVSSGHARARPIERLISIVNR